MPDSKDPNPRHQPEAMRATASLPGLHIEILHRFSADGEAEHVSINMRAVPSFKALARFLELANPFAFWADATRLFWSPWFAALRAVTRIGAGDVPRLRAGRPEPRLQSLPPSG